MVLAYIKGPPDIEELSLQALSHKTAMLMALSNAERCSDLVVLDLAHHTYRSNGVLFVIPGLTKTRRSRPLLETLYLASLVPRPISARWEIRVWHLAYTNSVPNGM